MEVRNTSHGEKRGRGVTKPHESVVRLVRWRRRQSSAQCRRPVSAGLSSSLVPLDDSTDITALCHLLALVHGEATGTHIDKQKQTTNNRECLEEVVPV